jgi:hypothetical protein
LTVYGFLALKDYYNRRWISRCKKARAGPAKGTIFSIDEALEGIN